MRAAKRPSKENRQRRKKNCLRLKNKRGVITTLSRTREKMENVNQVKGVASVKGSRLGESGGSFAFKQACGAWKGKEQEKILIRGIISTGKERTAISGASQGQLAEIGHKKKRTSTFIVKKEGERAGGTALWWSGKGGNTSMRLSPPMRGVKKLSD